MLLNPIRYQILPGIDRLFFRRSLTPDLVFFLIVVALPSSFFALLPTSFFLDIKVLVFIISSIYIFKYFKYIKKIKKLPAGKSLVVLNIYLILQVVYSLFYQNIALVEVATIFRTQFFYPIITFSFLLYISSMDNSRIYRFMYWVLLATFIQGLLFIFSNLTGLNPFAAIKRNLNVIDGVIIMRNLRAIPQYNEVLFSFSLITAITLASFKKNWLWIIPLLLTAISIVRSQIIVYLIVFILILFLTKVSKLKINVSKLFKLSLIIIFFGIFLLLIFPVHTNRLINRFGFDKKGKMEVSNYTEQGTFAVRLELIEDAYERTAAADNLMLGNGYIREAEKGEYDFVVGGDTLIAPVLFTEGFVGLFLRIIPIILLLFYFLKLLYSNTKKNKIFAIVGVALIFPEIINAVQTKIFVNYNQLIFILFILTMIIYNDKKIKNRIT